MKKSILMTAAPLLGLAVSACGGEPAEQADTTVAETETDTADAVAAPEAAQDYVETAAIGDMFEIQSSEIALEKAQSPELREFAQQMIDDHQRTTEMIQTAVAEQGLDIQPPAELDARHREMISALEGASPEEFDSLYREQQLAAHREAVDLHQTYAQMQDAPLADVAGEIAPMVSEHLETLEGMEADDEAAAG